MTSWEGLWYWLGPVDYGRFNIKQSQVCNNIKSLVLKVKQLKIGCVSFIYSYIIENGVCFLTLTEKTFSKRAAFSFLEELSSEFHREFGSKVATATRPYLFIEFGKLLYPQFLSLCSEIFFPSLHCGETFVMVLPTPLPHYNSDVFTYCSPKNQPKANKNRVVKYTCFSDFQVYHVNMRKVMFTEPNYVDVISDTFIQKARKNYQDSRTRRNLNRLNDELQDVQRIMVQNIDDVLQRGEQLSGEWSPFTFVGIKYVNPLHPNISMHILHTVLRTFPKRLWRRICVTIKSCSSWWSSPPLSQLLCLIQGWYSKEKLDASHS